MIVVVPFTADTINEMRSPAATAPVAVPDTVNVPELPVRVRAVPNSAPFLYAATVTVVLKAFVQFTDILTVASGFA